MPKFQLRADGNYDPNQASREADLVNFEETRTQQHQAEDTDINLIVRRYTQTGYLPQSALEPLYGDFETLSFHEAQQKIRAAEEAFMLLPAEIRARFHNSPGEFVDFASDPANEAELVKLKLRDPPKASEPPSGATEKPAKPAGEPANPPPQG